MGAFLVSFWVPSSGCLFHQLWHKLLGIGQATMGLTGRSPECPTIPSIGENKALDCATFGRTCAQNNAPNRIIGQECSHRHGNDIKRETQNFKTKLVGPTNLPGSWGCERYGEGWAHDPTYSHYKRAKPTYTDPEEDMKVDPSMPVGSKSKHEKYYSSVAGDTSEASTTLHNLGSKDESEGDAVRAWSDKPAYRR